MQGNLLRRKEVVFVTLDTISIGCSRDTFVSFTPRRGIDMPAPGNARGERMQHGYAPEGGKRITAHHCRVAKGVNGIIILLPILGDVVCELFPRRCLGLTGFWPFRPYFPQPSTLPSLGEGVGVGILSFCPSVRYEGGILSFCSSVRYEVTPHLKILYRGLKTRRNAAIV